MRGRRWDCVLGHPDLELRLLGARLAASVRSGGGDHWPKLHRRRPALTVPVAKAPTRRRSAHAGGLEVLQRLRCAPGPGGSSCSTNASCCQILRIWKTEPTATALPRPLRLQHRLPAAPSFLLRLGALPSARAPRGARVVRAQTRALAGLLWEGGCWEEPKRALRSLALGYDRKEETV